MLKEKGRHIITSKIEHHAILNSCAYLEKQGFEVTYLDVDEWGSIRLDVLEKAIRKDTILISVMYANNEVGTIQKIAQIGKIAEKNDILFHTDAVQAYGQLLIDVKKENIDFILAVGGGSVIDCCKVISSQAVIDEDIWDLEYVHGKFPTEGIPMGAIVTASGTGAEMNGGAVITHEEKNWKGGIFASTADFVVLDPVYTLTVPSMQVL